MTQNSLRANLASARFPLLTTKMGRSIILPQYDENYDRTNAANADDTTGKGVPQIFYMHNVMPTVEGYQSIAFTQKIAGVVGVANFDQVFTLRDSSDNAFIYVPGNGANYIYTAVLAAWQSTNPFTAGAVYSKTNISYAFLQGNHYVCVQGQGVYQYSSGTNTFAAVSFTGLTMNLIKGIATTSGYMICYDDTTQYWSSVLNPLDFVPSLITGAGSGAPLDTKGKIITTLQIAGGLILYTTSNVVSAQYTGNIRFPFVFKEVVGSGGIQTPEQVSYVSNFSEHYAITSSGVQKIDRTSATTLFDNVTDFLSANIYEDFDTPTLAFSSTKTSKALSTKIVLISNRYLVLSYGVIPGTYTYALIYDLSLKRWGKVKITHVDAFEYNWPNFFGTATYLAVRVSSYASFLGTAYKDISNRQTIAPTARTSISFIQSNGAVYNIDMSEQSIAADSVIVLGKYQMQRNRFFTLQTVDLDNVYDVANFKCYALTSLDGKNFAAPKSGYPLNQGVNTASYGFTVVGDNVSLLCVGTFSLNTVMINFNQSGIR